MNKLSLFAFFLLIVLTFSSSFKKKSLEQTSVAVESETSAPCTDDPTNCIPYWLDNQVVCTTSAVLPPLKKDLWTTLDANIDIQNLGVRVMAYKIQWFDGSWSDWYFPGVNDLDSKSYTVSGKKYLKRVWAYFVDHSHIYVTCK